MTRPYRPDSWNELVLDTRGWKGRSSVDRIEVSMRAVGTDFAAWNPHFQVDSLGFYDRPRAYAWVAVVDAGACRRTGLEPGGWDAPSADLTEAVGPLGHPLHGQVDLLEVRLALLD